MDQSQFDDAARNAIQLSQDLDDPYFDLLGVGTTFLSMTTLLLAKL